MTLLLQAQEDPIVEDPDVDRPHEKYPLKYRLYGLGDK